MMVIKYVLPVGTDVQYLVNSRTSVQYTAIGLLYDRYSEWRSCKADINILKHVLMKHKPYKQWDERMNYYVVLLAPYFYAENVFTLQTYTTTLNTTIKYIVIPLKEAIPFIRTATRLIFSNTTLSNMNNLESRMFKWWTTRYVGIDVCVLCPWTVMSHEQWAPWFLIRPSYRAFCMTNDKWMQTSWNDRIERGGVLEMGLVDLRLAIARRVWRMQYDRRTTTWLYRLKKYSNLELVPCRDHSTKNMQQTQTTKQNMLVVGWEESHFWSFMHHDDIILNVISIIYRVHPMNRSQPLLWPL